MSNSSEITPEQLAAYEAKHRKPPRIEPTVGRVVWYWPHPDTDLLMPAMVILVGQPLRADVCAVNDDGTVNLAVNDAYGDAHQRLDVPLLQAGEAPPAGRSFCEWMPYQKGQAAKTEELEAKQAGGHAG